MFDSGPRLAALHRRPQQHLRALLKYNESIDKMKWTEEIKDSLWIVEDLLTRDECERFLSRAHDAGILDKRSMGDSRHRDSTTVAISDAELAGRVFQRIRSHIPQEIVVDEDCSNVGLMTHKNDIIGRWTPHSLNDLWRVACYPGKGHFGPHRDGCYIKDEHHRSLITINGYLTDRPLGTGGATRFVKNDIDIYRADSGIFTTREEDVLHRVEADKAGKAVLFLHDMMHDGEPLKEGSAFKWIFRTEIIYERDPDTAAVLTEQQIEARILQGQAEKAEIAGDIPEAIKLYRRAYRLDPSLEAPES